MAVSYHVAFWNLENLFAPEGYPAREPWIASRMASDLKGWTKTRFRRKVSQLALGVAGMNAGAGPDLLGLCEAENRFVLDALIEALAERLPDRTYKAVHADAQRDRRGIDTGFLYDSRRLRAVGRVTQIGQHLRHRGVAVLGILAAVWRPLFAATVNRELAEAEGLHPGRANIVFMLLMAAVIAISMKIVGVLLITALLIIPAATARRFATGPEQMAVMAALIGAASVVGGLFGSLEWDTPSGPSIVVAALVLFLLALIPVPLGARSGQRIATSDHHAKTKG